MRMDAALSDADGRALGAEYHTKRLALRRIDAQLAGTPLRREAGDPPALYRAGGGAVRRERAAPTRTRSRRSAACSRRRATTSPRRSEVQRQARSQVLPHYREQERAFEKLSKDGFAGRLMYTDKQRERIEKEQDLKTPGIHHRRRAGARSRSRRSAWRRSAPTTGASCRPSASRSRRRSSALRQELAKQQHRHGLLELRAPHAGTVKDLATHTAGHRGRARHHPDDHRARGRDAARRGLGRRTTTSASCAPAQPAQDQARRRSSSRSTAWSRARVRAGQRRRHRGAQSQHALRRPRRPRPPRRRRSPSARWSTSRSSTSRATASATRSRPACRSSAEIHLGERTRARVPALAGAEGVPRGGARTLAGSGGLTAMAQYNPA